MTIIGGLNSPQTYAYCTENVLFGSLAEGVGNATLGSTRLY